MYVVALKMCWVNPQAYTHALVPFLCLTQVTPTKMAELTAKHCFLDADANKVRATVQLVPPPPHCLPPQPLQSQDGLLDLEEFKRWYHSEGGRALKESIVNTVVDMPAAINLKEVQKLTGLGSRAVNEVLPLFEDGADEEGNLTRLAFLTVFDKFLPHQSSIEYNRARLLLNRLFDVFDADGNGIVDCLELASGLVMLCGGSNDDRAGDLGSGVVVVVAFAGAHSTMLPDLRRGGVCIV